MHWAEPLAEIHQPSEGDIEAPEIEMAVLGQGSFRPLKKEPGGCVGFFKRTWKKFTESNPSRSSDDLDSLERYYLSE
ncbi:hypothetical protein BDFB_008349 [Asbolus verrucosus]|uniref:Uncharacterized protein n=1 Tax=Asbolus verrucosus TaxID=1661398 RepID=A0A482VGY0_ASBVE|nr:hypothetical protein BDFB_008349 [Asbolus verrucosus]